MLSWLAALSAPVQAQAPKTAQQLFNEAQLAYENGLWAAAAAGYREALQLQKQNGQGVASIRARFASALARSGDTIEAQRQIDLAIAIFKSLGIAKHEDLAVAYLTIGDLRRGELKFDAAVIAYRQGIAATEGAITPNLQLWGRTGIAYAMMTEKPDMASAALDEELADQVLMGRFSDTQKTSLFALKAMAELNRGDAKNAAVFIEKALALGGAMSSRVTLEQTRIRSDAAIIYSRMGEQEKVRKFLAYSGAGHLADGDALFPQSPELPICGAEISPQDFAVIEFAIGANGHADGAAPVFASRSGPIGAIFAASVKEWRWKRQAIAKLNSFWRASVRMELRCVKRPPAITMSDAFEESTEQWLAKAGSLIDLSDPSAQPLDPAKSPDRVMAEIANGFLALAQGSGGGTWKETAATLSTQLQTAQAPIEVQAQLAYMTAVGRPNSSSWSFGVARAAKLGSAAAAIQARPGGARAGAWLRAERAVALERSKMLDQAHAELSAVVATPEAALPKDDPIRSFATLHLAMLDRHQGNADLARNRLANAGLDADQCSLLDLEPIAQSHSIGNDAFPREALRWGFTGSVREAFDIAANGKVEDVRTIIAYPPFVFGPSTEKALASFRYLPPMLGDQPIGCVGQMHRINYVNF